MTTSILRPNSTVSSTGALTGAASVHAALSDDTNTSYVELDPGEALTVGLDNLSLPADGVITKLSMRVRTARISGSATRLLGEIEVGGGPPTIPSGGTVVTWSTPTTITLATQSTSADELYTDADVDAAELVVSTVFGTGVIRVYEAYLNVVYSEPPTVTVSAPAGTVTEDDNPAIEWTSDADPQTHFRAVYMADGEHPDTDTPIEDSGEVESSEESWVPGVLDDGTYDIYVKAAITVNGEALWSDWASGTVIIDVDRPANPTLTLTAESSAGRIKLDISDPGGGAVSADHFRVRRSDDGGVTFDNIRTVDGGGLIDPVAGEATIWDREAPNGVTVTYRVHATHDFTSGEGRSDTVEASGGWSSTDVWIKHPFDPTLDHTFIPRSQPSRQRAASQGSFKPLGASNPIVVGDERPSWQGEWTFMCETDEERDALEALVASLDPLLIQAPVETIDWDDTWVSIGDYQRSRLTDKSFGLYTDEQLPWSEVDRPDGNLTAWPDPDLPSEPGEDLILI